MEPVVVRGGGRGWVGGGVRLLRGLVGNDYGLIKVGALGLVGTYNCYNFWTFYTYAFEGPSKGDALTYMGTSLFR